MTGPADKVAVLADYRDRTIHAMTEVRAIGCVTDECGDQLSLGAATDITESVAEAVEALACMLGALQSAVDRGEPCPHDEINPGDLQGIYVCTSCSETLVQLQCRVCDVPVLPHHLAGHLTLRCWADDSPLITGAGS